MKALLVALLLFGSSAAFAQTAYVDIPVDEEAMAHAPADALKHMDEMPANRSVSKLSNKCSSIVERAASIGRAPELSSIGDYARMFVRGVLGQPFRDAYNYLKLKGEFMGAGCGDGARFDSLRAKLAQASPKIPMIPTLEASASVSSRQASNTTAAIRPIGAARVQKQAAATAAVGASK